jgi:DNA-binding CsgD family transcriptional regulator
MPTDRRLVHPQFVPTRYIRRVLFGREADLTSLLSAVGGRAPAGVVGEAGIGKTSLLTAVAAASGLQTCRGGGLATLCDIPYLSLERAVGRSLADEHLEAVVEAVAAAVSDGLLILDDLQWADTATLATVPLLATRVPMLVGIRQGDAGSEAALDAATGADAELIELTPLDRGDAEAIVRERNPSIDAETMDSIVAAAKGVPFYLEELAASAGEPTEALRTSLAARLRRRPQPEQRALAELALLSRPAASDEIGGSIEGLVAGGLVEWDPTGSLRLRHALVGDAVLRLLSGAERRELEAELAARLSDPAEAALHHLAAGQREAAQRAVTGALATESRVAGRARLLALAAEAVDPEESPAYAVAAAEAFVTGGNHADALDVLDHVSTDDPDLRAQVCLQQARALWFISESKRSKAAVEEGLSLVTGTGSPTEVRLRIQRVRAAVRSEYDSARGVALAEEAFALAEATGVERPRARSLLGSARLTAGDPRCIEDFRLAITEARETGDVDVECTALDSLATAFLLLGDMPASERHAKELCARASATGQLTWYRIGLVARGSVGFLARGDLPGTIADMQEALRSPFLARRRDEAEGFLAVCLADSARFLESDHVAPWQAVLDSTDDPARRAVLGWAAAERAWLAGYPAAAIVAADNVLTAGIPSFPSVALAATVRLWAANDLDQGPAESIDVRSLPLVAGAGTEIAALVSLSEGDAAEAVAKFDAAAEQWEGKVVRSALRCRWGAGEAARRAGDCASAAARLEAVEADAESLGLEPLVARIRQSLRRAGVRRAIAAGNRPGGLTHRQREILLLVGDGCSSAVIARRLGLSRDTVDAQVNAAMTTLGVRTRVEAAVRTKAAARST